MMRRVSLMLLGALAFACGSPRPSRPPPPPLGVARAGSTGPVAVASGALALPAAPDRARVEIVADAGHTDSVQCVAFSPDGRLVASGADDRTIKLWDAGSGRLVKTLSGHTGAVRVVRFTPDGTRLVSGSKDGSIGVWDVATGTRTASISANAGGVYALVIARDGRQMLSGGADKVVRVWDLASGRELRNFGKFREAVRDIALSRDGKRALVVSYWHGDLVQLFDVEKGTLTKKLGPDDKVENDVAGVSFTPDEKRAVFGYWGGKTKLWNLASGKVEKRIVTESLNNQPALLSDGRFVTKRYGVVELWDEKSGKRLREMKGHEHNVLAIALSPDEKRVVSGSIDRSVRVWDLASGAEVVHMGSGVGFYYAVAYSADGWRAARAVGRYADAARVWRDTEIHVFALDTGKEVGALAPPADEPAMKAVTALAFSPDGKQLLSGHTSGGGVRYWDLASGKLLAEIGVGGDHVNALAFLPDGRRAVALTELTPPLLLDLASGKAVASYGAERRSNTALALSPDGRVLATGHGGELVALWDVASGKQLVTSPIPDDEIEPGRLPPDVGALAFSPDGRLLAVGERSRRQSKIRLVNAGSGATLRKWQAHAEGVAALAFTPDGTGLLSGGEDAKLALWDVATGALKGADARYFGSVFCLHPLVGSVLAASKDTSLRFWVLPGR